MPGFRKLLKKWLGDSYEFLGLVLTSSLIWFAVTLLGFAAIVRSGLAQHPITLIASVGAFYVLVVAPLTAGVFALAEKIAFRNEPSLLDLTRGFRELLTGAWVLGLVQVVITLLIGLNAWFYLTHGGPVVKALGVGFLYLMLFWKMGEIYHYPLLVLFRDPEQAEGNPGLLTILRYGVLFTIDNFAFTLGLFFAIILLTCFCAATLLGLPLLYIGMAGILSTHACHGVLRKYKPAFGKDAGPAEQVATEVEKELQWPT